MSSNLVRKGINASRQSAPLPREQVRYWLENRRKKCPRTPFLDTFRAADHPPGISPEARKRQKSI